MINTKEILESARSKSKIDPEELAALVYRGKHRYENLKGIFKQFISYGAVTNPNLYEMSRTEAYGFSQKAVSNYRLHTDSDVLSEESNSEEVTVALNYHSPGSIGAVMSSNVVKVMGTDEQVKEWYPKILKNVWLACYAQTELGTGSDVQNLKTLAVYEPKTKEFIFHSPTTDSIKWWPGDLGLSGSHAIVFARLVSNGKDHGVQAFFVEIRNPLTHIPAKGAIMGDIGPKLGYRTKDNGYLKFEHFRAPSSCLLGRYIEIDAEGEVRRRGNPKRMYTAMMRTRSVILVMAYGSIFKAVTIAFRYSHLRTQFKDSKGNAISIYEYQMQREKLFKELARVFVNNLTTSVAFDQIQKNNELAEKDDYSELQSTHIMLCCFKATFTFWQSDSIANLIKACGGHGYSHYSGLPHILVEEFPNQILEGENTVLLMQVSRYLVKCWFSVQRQNTKKITGFFRFLVDIESLIQYKWSVSEIENPESYPNVFRTATLYLLNKVCLRMAQLMQSGKEPKEVWDTMVSNENLRLAKVYSIQLILECCWVKIRSIPEGHIKKAVTGLFSLASINLIEEYAACLVESGVLTADHIKLLFARKDALLDELKPHGLVLAEAMQWDDQLLASAIATQDKDPYETLFKWAKEEGALNQYENQIHPSVSKYQLKVSRSREQKL